ncbi:glycosyl hydrolase family 1-domain-containing protein [Scenedesmus sp. NREL 46B-D3]|nr:glycosyl hydrolase family 1-domain-containing protein [Scenedesmus sp. NREL 46B-D3]
MKKKSSGSIGEEGTRDANSQLGSDAAGCAAYVHTEEAVKAKKKGMSGLLSLGRRMKSSGNLSEQAYETSEPAPAAESAEPESYMEEPRRHVGGLLGRVKRAKDRRREQAEAAWEDDTAAANDTHTTHSRDQDQESSAAADSDESPSAAAAGDHSSAHHEVTAEEAEDRQAVYGLIGGGSPGSEEYPAEDAAEQQEAGSCPGEPSVQQTGDAEVEGEYAHAVHVEQAKADQGKGVFGLLGRPPSGSFSAILGQPKDEAQLAAELEAAAAAEAEAAAAAAAEAALRMEPEKEPAIRKFPRGFMWGTATSAYQIEGAYLDEGKGLSIWDAFCHTPGKISGNANADVTTCHYYRFKEDVALMAAMGVKYYRMSIAWSRIFPDGRGKVNERGVAFYNRVIDELIASRIMPVVTLYHWDLPLALQIEEDGWMNPRIVDHFVKYAKLCFSRFGDRVKFWITVNEPWCAAVLGHDSGGQHAPGRNVDPSREVYKVAHHMLIAHGRTYQMYQRAFKRKQRGKIGLALNGDWYEAKPAADLGEQRCNEKAAERALEFSVGWFARPVYQGDYPSLMRERCGNRLPRFTAEQRAMLVGSVDFFGLNHYSSHLCEQPAWYKELAPQQDEEEREGKLMKLGAQLERIMTTVTGGKPAESEIQEGDVADPAEHKAQLVDDDDEAHADPYIESTGYWQDISVDQSDDEVWKTTDMGWGVHPEGLRKMLKYIQREFNPRGGIIITENGCAVAEDDEAEALKDIERAVYLKRYLTEVHKALLHDNVDVRGYFVWSLLDNFEWGYGYQKKFGLHYVDLQTLERIPKLSANWYAEVIKKNRLES